MRIPSVSEENPDECEYYIVHDGLGTSHVMRHKKGVHPAISSGDCDLNPTHAGILL